MFKDSGDMRTLTNKSDLKNSINVVSSTRVVVVDGCTFLWSTLWPTKGCVNDFINTYIAHLLRLLKDSDVYLVFDRYFQFNIKCATRNDRGKSSLRAFNVNLSMPLPSQADILNHMGSKKQLIEIIVYQLTEIVQTHNFMNCLLITAKDAVPIELKDGELAYKEEWSVHHEEANVIITQQAIKAILERKVDNVRVISDDTDVSSHYHGMGKKTVLKKLELGINLDKVGDPDALLDVIEQATSLISSCYGYPSTDMSSCRTTAWFSKTAKAKTAAPKLENLPPPPHTHTHTTESFSENVKRAHFRVMIWKQSC